MTETAAPGQRVSTLMRVLLIAGAVLVLAAGTQLYVLTTHTDTDFAWTIANPLSAASIGAYHYGAAVIAALAGFQRRWDRARVGVPGILVFLWMTVGATIGNLSVFHLHDAATAPRVAAIGWLVVYLLDAPLLLVAYVLQPGDRRADPPREAPVPRWPRVACLVVGVPAGLVAVALYASPAGLAAHWGWPLTPIAAQTEAAWLAALGVLLVSVAVEGDALRSRPAYAGMAVLAALHLVAVARYPATLHGPAGTAWLVLFVLVGLLGVDGLIRARVRTTATVAVDPAPVPADA